MLSLAILILGIFSRLIIHIPNFTPVVALALFGGVYLKKKQALYIPIILLAISDFIIGWHNTMPFTWGSILLVSAVGYFLRERKSALNIVAGGIFSSVLFFLITNLGVWLVSGIYPMTGAGLADCFILALPFFRVELLSTLCYTVVLFGAYEVVVARIKKTRFASIAL